MTCRLFLATKYTFASIIEFVEWVMFLTCVLLFLVSEPNDESAANVDAAKKWREDRHQFEEIAKATVKKSLGL